MAEHELSLLKHSEHLLLDQPLLRLPNELLRKTFRSAHFAIEKDSSALKTLLKDSATAAVSGRAAQADVLRSLDAMLARMRGVKRKLAAYADDEARLHAQTAARIAHLDRLFDVHSVDDVQYEAWSRRRLDRLLADYLLRHGFHRTAADLAAERAIPDLVDVDTFVAMTRIRHSLLAGSVAEALAWCSENKKELRKMESKLEFMLRLQQYIELVRTPSEPKLMEAIAYAKKHLIPYAAAYPREFQQACGLLAFPPGARRRPPTPTCTSPSAGSSSQTSSPPPTTASSACRRCRCCTSPSRRASRPSRRPPATRPPRTRATPPPPRPATASAPSAPPSSTSWPATCPTPTTQRATSSTTSCSSPAAAPAAASASSTRPPRPACRPTASRTPAPATSSPSTPSRRCTLPRSPTARRSRAPGPRGRALAAS